MLRVHYPSQVQQDESCWRRFQNYLWCHSVEIISTDTVLDFLTWLADSTNRTPANVLAHYAVLADLLCFDFRIQVLDRALSFLLKGSAS